MFFKSRVPCNVCWVLYLNRRNAPFGFCVFSVVKNPYDLMSHMRFRILQKKQKLAYGLLCLLKHIKLLVILLFYKSQGVIGS